MCSGSAAMTLVFARDLQTCVDASFINKSIGKRFRGKSPLDSVAPQKASLLFFPSRKFTYFLVNGYG